LCCKFGLELSDDTLLISFELGEVCGVLSPRPLELLLKILQLDSVAIFHLLNGVLVTLVLLLQVGGVLAVTSGKLINSLFEGGVMFLDEGLLLGN